MTDRFQQRGRGRRVVFFLQGQIVPASRVRGVAIARALEREGIECDLRFCTPSVYGDTGLSRRWPKLRPLFYPAALVSRLGQLDLRDDDLAFFQRPMFEWPVVWLERLVARGRPAIFDFDDAIYLNFRGREKLRQMVALVDGVIAGNRTLAEAAAAPEKTTVIPTVLDLERYTPRKDHLGRGSQVTVGWTGTHGNYRQLAIAREGIARALGRTGARFLIIADRPPPPELAELSPEFLPWRPDTEVEDLARIDIGVMPLPDNPYSRGKCGFKLLQYMALGHPGVASPVGVNADIVHHGVNGFAARDDREWEESLVALIDDPQLRSRMGAAARARVEAEYSIAAVLPRYLQMFDRCWGRTAEADRADTAA